jgi:hypothetical protein
MRRPDAGMDDVAPAKVKPTAVSASPARTDRYDDGGFSAVVVRPLGVESRRQHERGRACMMERIRGPVCANNRTARAVSEGQVHKARVPNAANPIMAPGTAAQRALSSADFVST